MPTPKELKKRKSFLGIMESKFSPKAGAQQRCLYLFMLVAIAVVCLVALFSETLAPCPNVSPLPAKLESVFPNPAYNARACRTTRVPALLWLTPLECDLTRRSLLAVVLGTLIGLERRRADRPRACARWRSSRSAVPLHDRLDVRARERLREARGEERAAARSLTSSRPPPRALSLSPRAQLRVPRRA